MIENRKTVHTRRATWCALVALAVALALPVAAAPQGEVAPTWMQRILTRVVESLRFAAQPPSVPERASWSSVNARARHHLAIEPGGEPVPPPPGDGLPPAGG